MNEHLYPIFETILPAFEKAGIRYWIIGGVAIAGIVGKFLRENKDVDVVVLEEDYEKAIAIAETLTANFGWTFIDSFFNQRPKREFFRPGIKDDAFSIMPIYYTDDVVNYVFQTSTKQFPSDILIQVNRETGVRSFFTPKTEFIKDLFLYNVSYLVRSGKFRDRPEIRHNVEVDRTALLNEGEWTAFLKKFEKHLPPGYLSF